MTGSTHRTFFISGSGLQTLHQKTNPSAHEVQAKHPSGRRHADSPMHREGSSTSPVPERTGPGSAPAARPAPRPVPQCRDTGRRDGGGRVPQRRSVPRRAVAAPPAAAAERTRPVAAISAGVPVSARGRGAAAGGVRVPAGVTRCCVCPHGGAARGCCQRSGHISTVAISAPAARRRSALPGPAACLGCLHNEDLRDQRHLWPRLAPRPWPGAHRAQGPSGRPCPKRNPRRAAPPCSAERSALS